MSCGDKKEPEPDLSIWEISGLWYYTEMIWPITLNRGHYFEFKTDNTYSYVTENETVNGIFRIKEREQTAYSFIFINGYNEEVLVTYDNVTLYKILVSGSNDYDQLWLYRFTMSDLPANLAVHIYSGNELVQILNVFVKGG